MGRISIAGLLGFVAMIAVGLAAITSGSAAWVGLSFTLMFGVLFTCLLAVLLRGRGGPAWIGAALFGWGFCVLGRIPATSDLAGLLSDAAAGWIFEKANSRPAEFSDPPSSFPFQQSPEALQSMQEQAIYRRRQANAQRVGSHVAVLLLAQVGSLVAMALARGRSPADPPPSPR